VPENHESFFERLRPFFAPSILRKIELAYILAKHGHRGQTRKELDEHGDPVRYFEHVRRATLLGIELARIVRFDTIVASVLHDTFEDTTISPELVEDCFGSDVCGIVKVLSKTPKEGYLERFHMCTDWRPYFIKACDRLDNLRALPQAPPPFRVRQVTETRTHYVALFDRMLALTPEPHREGVVRLRDAIHEATDAVSLS
jgi:GTP diphosphokinase / guanosine-3',5'-bis(diphosphate) 3'-diphosphatase